MKNGEVRLPTVFVCRRSKVITLRLRPRKTKPRPCNPTLLTLPAEIRTHIYRYAVTLHKSLELATLRPPPLAMASRQLWQEVLPVLFASNHFHVWASPAWTVPPSHAVAPPRSIPQQEATIIFMRLHGNGDIEVTRKTRHTLAELPKIDPSKPDFDLQAIMERGAQKWLEVASSMVQIPHLWFRVKTQGVVRPLGIHIHKPSGAIVIILPPRHHVDGGIASILHAEQTAMHLALEALIEKQKQRLQARNLEGLTLREIAELGELFDVGRV